MSTLRGNSSFGRMIECLGRMLSKVPCWIKETPNHLKTQGMCDVAVRMEPCSLGFVPDHLKTQGMCSEAVQNKPWLLKYVLDCLRTQKIREGVMHVRPAEFFLIPNRFKTQEMCLGQLGWTYGTCTMSLITLEHKKCVIRQ